MAAPINTDVYSDVLVVLGTAAIVVPTLRRFGISPVLAYLAAGVVLGPLGLGSFIEQIPLLYWFTIVDAKSVAAIAELGVVFLLFLIGLELSYDRLKSMRRLVFGFGELQVLVSTIVVGGIAAWFGSGLAPSIIFGACLSLSSTAIVVEILSRQGRLATNVGRSTFAVLLAQDLSVVPILLFISILGAGAGGSVLTSLLTALLHAGLALTAIVVVGRLLLRPLFRLVASHGTSDLFVAAALFVIVGTGVITAMAGASMALGAFVAGVLLSETEFRKAIETTIDPFKGLLLGVFFLAVGMTIDVRELVHAPLSILASVVGLIAIKAIVVTVLARLFRLPWATAIEAALLLGPGGEFAFVGITMARTRGLVDVEAANFVLTVTAITMILIPALSFVARRLRPASHDLERHDPELAIAPREDADHAVVIGYGRVGQVVCTMLDRHDMRYVAVDSDPDVVPRQRRIGREVFYGDATNPEFLKRCGVMKARGVIVTVASRAAIDEIIQQVRALRPDVLIVSRARDAGHASHLYTIGVTDAVPETIEASLQLSEAALVGLGLPMGRAIASIHEQRDEIRRELQHAAGRAGVEATHSVRARQSS